jgi:hypothetical protein
VPVAADAPPLEQEQSPYRAIFLQKAKHHVNQDPEFLPRGSDTFGGQAHPWINLLPRILENSIEKTLFVSEVLDELRLAGSGQPTDRRSRRGFVAALGEQDFGGLPGSGIPPMSH